MDRKTMDLKGGIGCEKELCGPSGATTQPWVGQTQRFALKQQKEPVHTWIP